MTSITKVHVAFGCIAAVLLTIAAPAGAQPNSGNADDPLSHMVSPGSNGQCWISTDQAFNDRGFGYWGACANASAAESSSAHPHAEAHPRHHAQH